FLLAGPLALAWKKQQKLAFLVVQGTFGEFIFQTNEKTPQELRATVAPWASLKGLDASSLRTDTSAGAHANQNALSAQREKLELLRELGELRTTGVLTQEEFDTEKA